MGTMYIQFVLLLCRLVCGGRWAPSPFGVLVLRFLWETPSLDASPESNSFEEDGKKTEEDGGITALS